MSDPYTLPPLHMPRGNDRPPLPRKPPTLPTGPRLYRQTRKNQIRYGGPGPAPQEFLRASTSYPEWMFYWASMRALDPDRDPRQGPFSGGKDWDYQSPELGAFTRQLGSAVVDYLYRLSYPYLAVRLQTYRFHLAVDSIKQASDRQQLLALYGKFDVLDVYESDFISDETGEAAILIVKEVVGLVHRQDPLTAGTTTMVRSAFVV